jgi:hypothetical protein
MNDADSDFHPLANIFPMMDEGALNELVADIREHGMLERLTVYEGKILDGRNRYRALQRIDPTITMDHNFPPVHWVLTGTRDDALDVIISQNLRRRHLDTGQRAAVAAKLAKLRDGQRQVGQMAEVPTQAEAAKLLNVSERSVRRAREVLNHGTAELIAAVEQGEVPVAMAADIAKLPVNEQREVLSRGEKEVLAAAKDIRTNKMKAPKANGNTTEHDDMPTAEEAEESYQETIYDQACLFLESMTGATRQRLFAHISRDFWPELESIIRMVKAQDVLEEAIFPTPDLAQRAA